MTSGQTTQKEESPTVAARWDIPYEHAAGPQAAKFFAALRDEKKIYGIRCSQCRRVLLPPRGFCEACFADTDEWVELAHEGVVTGATIQYMGFPGLPDPPYAVGLVKLDGADTGILAMLGGVDLADPEEALQKIGIGCRVKAVFREERIGRITDLDHFEPV